MTSSLPILAEALRCAQLYGVVGGVDPKLNFVNGCLSLRSSEASD